MLKATISRGVSSLITSARVRAWRRSMAAGRRLACGAEPVVHYFHQADDPYSQLTAQLLPALRARWRVRFVSHLVDAPDSAAAPDRERLQAWSHRDAGRLAASLRLVYPFADAPFAGDEDASEGTALRRRLGHYLGATFHFEGEWYWGVDRLHGLERRLAEAGLARSPDDAARGPLLPPPALQWRPMRAIGGRPELHFYGSLRSPYTYLAAARVRRLAEHYGAELKLRFVLPMVMRGMPVPAAKRLYILRDAKREAERLGLPFGRIVDPVGAPAERGLAVLHRAMALGRGPALAESFLQGVFADGIDAGTRRGLLAIGARAGMAAAEIEAALADASWRDAAEANRAEMFELGLWGVPSFRIGDRPALWGQDRLWMLEQDLIECLAASDAHR